MRVKYSVSQSHARKFAPVARRRGRSSEPLGAGYRTERPESHLKVLASLAIDGPATADHLTWRLGYKPKTRTTTHIVACLAEEGLVDGDNRRPRWYSITETGLLVVGK